MSILSNLLGASSLKEQIKSLVSKNLSRKDWIHVMFLRWNSIKTDWCFDIPVMGIEDEPFVSGMEDIIDKQLIKADKLAAAKKHGICVLFSGGSVKPKAFSHGHYFSLTRQRQDNGGCWYKEPESGYEGWLCPNLYQYFASPPNTIHICIRD
jgi:hypothetical protein